MVVTLPLSVVVPPAFVVRLASGVVAPTVVLKSVVPVVFATSACPPFTAPVKVMFPAPAVAVRPALSVVAPEKRIAAPVAVPPAFVVSTSAVPPTATAFENVTGPPAVVKFAFRLMFSPVPAVSVIAFVFVCEIAALTVIAPLLLSPICTVAAVTRSSSASESSSVPAVGPPLEPRLMSVPLVVCFSVAVPVVTSAELPSAMLFAAMVSAPL